MLTTVDFILLGLGTLLFPPPGFFSHDFHTVLFIENIGFCSGWLFPICRSLSSWLPQSQIVFIYLCFCLAKSYIFFQIQLASSFHSTTVYTVLAQEDLLVIKFGCICSYGYASISCLVNLWVGCLSFTWKAVSATFCTWVTYSTSYRIFKNVSHISICFCICRPEKCLKIPVTVIHLVVGLSSIMRYATEYFL